MQGVVSNSVHYAICGLLWLSTLLIVHPANAETEANRYPIRGEVIDDPDRRCPPGASLIDEGWLGWHSLRVETCAKPGPDGRWIHHGPSTVYTEQRFSDDRPPPVRSEEIEYQDGERHGSFRHWNTAQTLTSEKQYEHGKLHGVQSAWYDGGMLRERVHFDDGRLHGTRTHWEPDGELRYEAFFEGGDFVSATGRLSVEGRPCPKGSLPVGGRPPHSYVEFCALFEADGERVRHGPWVQRRQDGQLRQRGEYRHGEKNGLFESWREGETGEPSHSLKYPRRNRRDRLAIMLGIVLLMPMLSAGVLTPIAYRRWSPSPRRAGWWGMFLAVGMAAPLLLFVERPSDPVPILLAVSLLMCPGALIGSWAGRRWLTHQARTNALPAEKP